MTIFVSYTRADEALVRALRDDLGRMGREVWMDHEIHGGELWWREIIRTIRSAKVFVFALSQASWKSLPCRQEFEYARALGLPVLPVQVGPLANLRIPIMERQLVDYRERDANAIVNLVAALTELTSRPLVLPDPLPEPPRVPFEYLYRIAELLGPAQITPERQEDIVGQLRRHLKTEEDAVARADIVKLLREFRERGEITRNNSREIDEILAGLEPEEGVEPPGGETRLPAADHWRRTAGERPGAEEAAEAGEAVREEAAREVAAREEPVREEEREETGAAGAAAEERQVETPPFGMRPVVTSNPETPTAHTSTAETPARGTAPEWLRGMVVRGDERRGTAPRPPAEQWWDGEQAQAATVPAGQAATGQAPAAQVPAGQAPAGQVAEGARSPGGTVTFVGTLLGALGLPLLLIALTGGEGSPVAVTVLLILAVLGLSLTVVGATRGEARARTGIVIAVFGILGAVAFAASTGFFS
ncbi:toll/interleukin-1 receptor domain-containing protein [Saccharothrix sp. Mg75]|uniref:toll/interleukin-1 receptor domain-containing protein n=1 Tax=Saccharothrix sp. Mg75 TaxID=3445357 RepID=UPI003EECFA42